MVIKSGLK